mmetsp:Transcript_27253/g.45430  ORF Transcript_27253/g.45430 Transcript_27253/m.45430 type:complete len:352 (+) Transcript_27253:77-1132(+)|eukprot:CAMPEP_0119013964 /NCGR_PEP_ID=MMETSP1176-20130426/9280_1 /TAXON_ID=265551 /ORGANISM="Synedropsis recta cf, Strain CCMP1620" /LENGTH=351 /DNA_ID=CAMNT_0006967095 /DNA_START=77 /DNA_END=1132 /DNA_ORIENTATION=+
MMKNLLQRAAVRASYSSSSTLSTPCYHLQTISTGRRYFQTATITEAQNKRKQKREAKPGFKAFAECEYEAMVDLFHHHAKEQGHLDRDGISRLLKSIGTPSSEATLDEVFASGDLDGNGVISLEEFLQCADEIMGDAPARIVLVVGGPGSGKGVLCSRLEKDCNVVHLSSGDLLRCEVRRSTVLGKEVAEIMKRGELVSSAVIVALVKRRMRHHPGKRVLLDGFPRSLQNAHDMVELCGKPELALHLECDDTVMLERILKRKEGRADDNIDTALQRLRTYHKSHNTTMDWLREQHVPVVNLDCSGTSDQVWDQLLAIGRLMRPAVKVRAVPIDEDDDHDDDDSSSGQVGLF